MTLVRILRPARRPAALPAALLLLAALAVPGEAGAQVRSVSLTSDNDAYLFWEPLRTRSDREYTNGLELQVEMAGAPAWGRALARGAARCDGGEDAAHDCTATTVDFGQKIFTPRVDDQTPLPGQRPYAGWLYLRATGHLQSAARRRSVGVEAGVTGEPSLGRAVHLAWHRVTGFWEPEGWDHQLRFEPGVAVRYDEARLLALRAGEGRVATVAPEWGAALGNVLTEAHAGVRARVGWRVPHPWSAAADRGQRAVSVYALGGVRQRAVAHNLFLDGNTFGSGPRVERRPWVTETEVGAGVGVGRLRVEYRVETRGREYRTEPAGHQYSTFALTWRVR